MTRATRSDIANSSHIVAVLAVLALAVLALAGCAAAPAQPDPRAAVEAAIVAELVPDTLAGAAEDGDAAAAEFVEQMHGLAESMAGDMLDDGACESQAYATQLAGDPTLVAAHEQGCAVLEAAGG